MIEIKFRGKLMNETWVYGLLCKPTAGEYSGKTFISNSVGIPMGYEVRPETVGQFTGLKDKNSKEIYEGDVVNFKDLEHCEGWKMAEIVYSDFGTRFVARTEYGDCQFYSKKFIEILGNIYQNSELLIQSNINIPKVKK